MCECSPTNLRDRYCGKGACIHPETKAMQREHDARAAEPAPKSAHHPAIVEGHLGVSFEWLDGVIAGAENGVAIPVLPTAGLALLLEQTKVMWTAAHNNGRREAVQHYRGLAKVVDDAKRIFDAVNDSRASTHPHRHATMLKHARKMLEKALDMLHKPHPSAHGVNGLASLARDGEAV